jgi:ABC-type bacteriocin/lantibiotic exporter with double-glycine peptidase domain
MVLSSLGLDISETELRARCDCTFNGTEALQAVDVARQLGFTRSAKHTLNETELRDLIAGGLLPIVFISLLPLDAVPQIHAVVVVEFTDQSVVVLDPLQGERQLAPQIFNTAWAKGRHLAILIER